MNRSIMHRQYEVAPKTVNGANARPSKVVDFFQAILQAILDVAVKDNEPKILQIRDRHGQIWWRAYDPKSRRSLVCTTEDEVRLWLDQLPYG